MHTSLRSVSRLAWSLLSTVIVLTAVAAPAAAQGADGLDNVVQISITPATTGGKIRVVNRGVGLCKAQVEEECGNQVTWRWTGGPDETRKIVIQFHSGTDKADTCLADESGTPQQVFELPMASSAEVTATVSEACPNKSAWIYEIRCVVTQGASAGQDCPDIAPVDPGVVIG